MARRLIAPAVACAIAVACSADPAQPPELLPMHEVLSIQNAMTGMEVPTGRLIMDRDAWAAAWATIFAEYAPTQRPALPDVDFRSNIMVLAAAGLRGAQGFFFTIKEVRAQGGMLQVLLLERWPTCGTLPALSAPVYVVTVPRVATTADFTVIKEGPPSCS